MKRTLTIISCLAISSLVWSGCQNPDNSPLRPVATGVQESPFGSVVSGETTGIEGYIAKIKESNEQVRQEEKREMNKDTVRAFNLSTGQYEYVEPDSLQRWNEEEKRWEFQPE